MTNPFPVHAAALLLALSALSAQAQGIYRCGDSYSNSPCTGAALVATDAPPSAADRARADAATRRDMKLAQALEKDRLQLESRAAPPLILKTAPFAPAAWPASNKPVVQGKLKKPEQFTAVSPKKPGEAAAKKKKPATA
jgi:hypothetical protein